MDLARVAMFERVRRMVELGISCISDSGLNSVSVFFSFCLSSVISVGLSSQSLMKSALFVAYQSIKQKILNVR